MSDAFRPAPLALPVAPSLARETLSWFAWLTLFLIVVPASLVFLPGLAVLSLCVILASLWMMQRLVPLFNLRQVTIPAIFYYAYFAVILIPGFFIYADEITPSRGQFLFGVESVMLAVPFGIAAANLFFGFDKAQINRYFSRSYDAEALGQPAVRLFVLFLLGAVAVIAINIKETREIPLFYLLRHPGEALTAAVLREDAFKLLNSHLTYLYAVLRGTILPFLVLVAFGRYRFQQRRPWRRLFLLSLLLGIFYASLTIEKSPVAAFFGMLFIAYYFLKGGRVGRLASIGAPILFFCFPLAVVLLAYHGSQSGSLENVIRAIGIRLFYSPAQIVYAYFEVFPAVVPYQHGASIVKLAGLLGWKSLDIPNAVGMYMNNGTDLNTITANSCFIGNLNADFGLAGVVIGSILAGFFMQAVSIYFCRRPKTAVTVGAHAVCMWAFALLVTTALPTTLLSGGVTFAFLLTWVFCAPVRKSFNGFDSQPAFAR